MRTQLDSGLSNDRWNSSDHQYLFLVANTIPEKKCEKTRNIYSTVFVKFDIRFGTGITMKGDDFLVFF